MAYTVLKLIALMTSLFVIDVCSVLKSYALNPWEDQTLVGECNNHVVTWHGAVNTSLGCESKHPHLLLLPGTKSPQNVTPLEGGFWGGEFALHQVAGALWAPHVPGLWAVILPTYSEHG